MAQKSHGSRHGTRHKFSRGPRDRTTINEHLKEFEEGEKVRIQMDSSVQEGRVHQRYQGEAAEVVGTRGDAYKLVVKDGGKQKELFLKPIHLQSMEE